MFKVLTKLTYTGLTFLVCCLETKAVSVFDVDLLDKVALKIFLFIIHINIHVQ